MPKKCKKGQKGQKRPLKGPRGPFKGPRGPWEGPAPHPRGPKSVFLKDLLGKKETTEEHKDEGLDRHCYDTGRSPGAVPTPNIPSRNQGQVNERHERGKF